MSDATSATRGTGQLTDERYHIAVVVVRVATTPGSLEDGVVSVGTGEELSVIPQRGYGSSTDYPKCHSAASAVPGTAARTKARNEGVRIVFAEVEALGDGVSTTEGFR